MLVSSERGPAGPPIAPLRPSDGDDVSQLLAKYRKLTLLRAAYDVRMRAAPAPAALPHAADAGAEGAGASEDVDTSLPSPEALPTRPRPPLAEVQAPSSSDQQLPRPHKGREPRSGGPPQARQEQQEQQPGPGKRATGSGGGSGSGGARRFGAVPLAAASAPLPPQQPAAPQPMAPPPLQLAPIAPTPVPPLAAAGVAPLPPEAAETPIANLAVRLFHEPPTTGQRPAGPSAHGRRRSSMAGPQPPLPRPSPQLRLDGQADPQHHRQQPGVPAVPAPWAQQAKPAPEQRGAPSQLVRQHQQQQQQQHHHWQPPQAHQHTAAAAGGGGGWHAAPQLHLTRPAASPCTWDAQSQACGAPGGWPDAARGLGWARIESQCAATWSPPCLGDDDGPLGRREEGGPPEAAAGGGGSALEEREQQQRWQQDEQHNLDSGFGRAQRAQGGHGGGRLPLHPVDDGTQPPPGWEDTQPPEGGGPPAADADDDAEVVPPTPIKTGDDGGGTASVAVPATVAPPGRRRLGDRTSPAAAERAPRPATSPALRKRRLPSLAPDGGGAPNGPAPASAPGRILDRFGPVQSTPSSSSGGGVRPWQPRGLPAAGPSAHEAVPLFGTAQPGGTADQQAQLRLQLGAPIRRLLPVCSGVLGVLLDGAAGGGRRGKAPRSPRDACSYRLFVIGTSASQQQQQQHAGDLASLMAWGPWQLDARAPAVAAAETAVACAAQLLPRVAPASGARETLLAAVAELAVSDAEDGGEQQLPAPAAAGVNIWLLSGSGGHGGGGAAGSGRARAQLLQALPTGERMHCVATGGGVWLAGGGDGGRAYVWPLAQPPDAALAEAEEGERRRQEQQQKQRVRQQGGWHACGGGDDDGGFFEAPTRQQVERAGEVAAAHAAAEPVDAAGRIALPPATLRGMPFTELSEVCLLPPPAAAAGAAGRGGSSGWLLAGCSAAGALALWDVGRAQLLVAAFPSLGGLSQLLPLPRAFAEGGSGGGRGCGASGARAGTAAAPRLPVALLARVPAADGSGQQLSPIVLHAGGAAVGSPLPLHMSVDGVASCASAAAAVASDGTVAAWDLVSGGCLLRGALPRAARRSGSQRGSAAGAGSGRAAAAGGGRGVVGFLSEGVLAVGTCEGALHLVQL
ncbi:hypothetical protein Rsub_01199 [Raphidocelis subcapitata]|uniref:Uncharacterized protein n=1 Tax=Raphidocelis subcapitata TaxID=307507 RepID=A0A2V0NM05_9CHLO|nr:hypothetical protein Rsub_01199 [Raphidocelis subcapitata]|eukprot:GBF88486.1 hypothetical protein Rsub_01199 [Raphidocelis subcapitata]